LDFGLRVPGVEPFPWWLLPLFVIAAIVKHK